MFVFAGQMAAVRKLASHTQTHREAHMVSATATGILPRLLSDRFVPGAEGTGAYDAASTTQLERQRHRQNKNGTPLSENLHEGPTDPFN